MMTLNMMAKDAHEGISAFIEKENLNGKINENRRNKKNFRRV